MGLETSKGQTRYDVSVVERVFNFMLKLMENQ